MSSPPPGNEEDARAWAQEVVEACERLPPTERDVLMLAYYGKRSQDDIASYLDLTRAAVSRCIADGLRRLSALIDPRGRI